MRDPRKTRVKRSVECSFFFFFYLGSFLWSVREGAGGREKEWDIHKNTENWIENMESWTNEHWIEHNSNILEKEKANKWTMNNNKNKKRKKNKKGWKSEKSKAKKC